MPLDITFKTDIAGLRDLARWCGQASESLHGAGSSIQGVRSNAESEWGGPSGQAFTGAMSKFGKSVDHVSDNLKDAKRKIDSFADDMTTVKSRLHQAKDVATKAELEVSDTQIKEPAPAPDKPTGDPGDHPGPQASSVDPHDKAAADKHAKQVKAYKECEKIVSEAKEKKEAAEKDLNFIEYLVEESPFKAAELGTTIAQKVSERASKFDSLSKDYAKRAVNSYKTMLETAADPSDPAYKAAIKGKKEALDKLLANQSKIKGPFSKFFLKLEGSESRLGKVANTVLTKDLKDLGKSAPTTAAADSSGAVEGAAKSGVEGAAEDGGKFLGSKMLGRIPVAGTIITAVGSGIDLAHGDVGGAVKNAAGGVAGMAAGEAIGGAVGSAIPIPGVGTAVGMAVGAGVGYVADKYGDDIAGGAKDLGRSP